MNPAFVKVTRRAILIVAWVCAAGSYLGCYQPFGWVQKVQREAPDILFYVPTTSNCFALTFDDGPNPLYTDQVLEVLDRYNAKATFFLIGSHIEKHPEYVEKIRARGHQVANHLYKDRKTILLRKEEMLEYLEKTEGMIHQTTPVRYFRPGGGWITPEMAWFAREKNYQTVLGSAYVFDTLSPPRWYMLNALKSMVRPGSIVVLHDGGGNRQKTVDILPALLEHVKKVNLVPVTLEELIQKGTSQDF